MNLRAKHHPSLDGVRALAVLTVVAYHLGAPFARGGFLGVDLFFVLSGFLITTLLLEERLETGRLALTAFWRRRARRLLPALFAMLTVVVFVPWFVTTFISTTALAGFDVSAIRGGALASWFYIANWFAIVHGHSYFAQLALPSPLNHTWSLAIEEQFYLVWPLVTLALVGRRAWRRSRGVLATLALAVASSLAMALLYHPNTSAINFVYNATFTRLFDLGVGASLAWYLVAPRDTDGVSRWLRLFAPTAAVAWLGLAVVAGDTNETPHGWMFQGGFFVAAILGATLIGGAMVPGPWARALSWRPLVVIGQVSYGLYLWHWPVIAFLSTTSTGLQGWSLTALRVVTMAVATGLSYRLLEQPIRQQRWSIRARRSWAVSGTVVSLAAIIVFTSTSLFPAPNVQTNLAAYAQVGTPVGAGAITGSLDARWLAAQHFSPTHKYQVMVIGDSVPYYSQWGLQAALDASPDIRARVAAFVGFGLDDTEYANWFLQQIRTWHPHLVIVMLTYDEGRWAVDPTGYHRRARTFFQQVFSQGVRNVAFATMPPTRGQVALGNGRRANAHRLNLRFRAFEGQLVRELGSRAVLLNLAPILERHGRFATWLPAPSRPDAAPATWVRVRMIDGVHFCQVGTELYASALAWDITSLANLPRPVPGWETAPWWKKKLYYFPQGASWCPDDHPR
jgi:peptidoglycan/LPS O-acetylase OafA/YrhL